MSALLLAEIEFSLGIGLLISLATILLTVGGTWALNKHKLDTAIQKIKSNDEGDKELATEVRSLKDELKESMRDMEVDSRRQVDDFKSKIFGKVDEVKDGVSEVKSQVGVIESELEHVKKEQERQRRKITLFGTERDKS